MKRSYSPFKLPPWLRQVRLVTIQFIIPITVFQGIRTIIFPTTFDVLLLVLLVVLAIAFRIDVI